MKNILTEALVNSATNASFIFQLYKFCKVKDNNENSTNEIDFVVQLGNVYPIEVKAEENLKSKSMNTLLNENEDMEGWKFSMSTYRTFKQVVNIPLYDVDEWILMYKEKMLEI